MNALFQSFETQTEKQETSKATQISTKQADMKIPIAADNHESHNDTVPQAKTYKREIVGNTAEQNISTKTMQCKECGVYAFLGNALQPKPIQNQVKTIDQSMQTEKEPKVHAVDTEDEKMTTCVREKSKSEEPRVVTQNTESATIPENYLTPEKMLKLLEQAQISPPVDATKLTQKCMSSCDYNGIMDQNQRHRQVVSLEKLLFGDSNC